MVGTILLVAIAIVLGALVGAYVFNIYQKEAAVTPHVTFSYEYDDGANELTITHESGDKFRSSNVNFVKKEGSGDVTVLDEWPKEVTSGDTTTLGNVAPTDVILIVWEQPIEGGKTAILDEWEGPKA